MVIFEIILDRTKKAICSFHGSKEELNSDRILHFRIFEQFFPGTSVRLLKNWCLFPWKNTKKNHFFVENRLVTDNRTSTTHNWLELSMLVLHIFEIFSLSFSCALKQYTFIFSFKHWKRQIFILSLLKVLSKHFFFFYFEMRNESNKQH